MLEPEASAALRDQLTAELKDISSAEEAANWAHRVLGAKNSLTSADAEHVERGFPRATAERLPTRLQHPRYRTPNGHRVDRVAKSDAERSAIDKSVLALPAPRRIRDREHVKSVAKQPCLICGRRPADAHHLRFAQSPALGRKVSDEFTVPAVPGTPSRGPSLWR